MRKEDIWFSIDRIAPSDMQKKKMLSEIQNGRNKEKIRMRRLTFAAAAAVILLCIAVLPPVLHSSLLMQTGSTGSESQSEDTTLGNTVGNTANGGLAVEDNNYIYYINCADGGSIWRSDKNGKNMLKLNSCQSKYLNIKDEYLYYINNSHNENAIHCMKTDGSEDWEVYNGYAKNAGPVDSLIISGNKLYYLSSGMIFRCSITQQDGLVSVAEPTEIKVKGSVHQFTLGSGGNIYYSLMEGDTEVYYVLNTIKNTTEKLCEGTKTESGVNGVNGFLYYSDANHHLTAFHIDTGNENYNHYSKITDSFPIYINALPANNHRVFYSTKDELRMFQQTFGGSSDKLIAQMRAYNINVAGNYVFFTGKDNMFTYRVNMDGTGKVEKLGTRNSSDIASNYVTVGDKTYRIAVKQTQVQRTPAPSDKNISLWESKYYGKFDLICYDTDENETDRIALNPLFGNKTMGFIDEFNLNITYYPKIGKADFNIGYATATYKPDGGLRAKDYLIFSLDKDGNLENMPIEGDYLYIESEHHSTELSTNSQTELQTDRTGVGEFLYNWDGTKWMLDKTSQGYKNLTLNITGLRAVAANEIPQELLFFDVKDKQVSANLVELGTKNTLNGIYPFLTIKENAKDIEAFTESLKLEDWQKSKDSDVSKPVMKIYLTPNLCLNLHAKTNGVYHISISTKDTTEYFIVPASVYDTIKNYPISK